MRGRATIDFSDAYARRILYLGNTLSEWLEEIVRMWRYTKSNGITVGKTDTLSRLGYAKSLSLPKLIPAQPE